MPGKVKTWPAWREYPSYQDSCQPKDQDYVQSKKSVLQEYGADALKSSWLQVCHDLEDISMDIANKQSSCIPIFHAKDILDEGFSQDQVQQIKRYGCFIVRQIIPQESAARHYQELKTYITENQAQIQAWPTSSPSMLLLYDSPTQIAVRTHPSHLKLQQTLNKLWHDDTGKTISTPLLYSDGVRDRPPNQTFLGLGPHIDAGSLCRWADSDYRKVYKRIFSGKPREHDAFDLSVRKHANQFLYPGPAHSTVFRSFQGWTALTKAAPGQGTILLYPNVSTVIAYILLRPFFQPPTDAEDILDASKWRFDAEGSYFPGTFKEQSQYISRTSHPHLRLEDCLVHIPSIQPGDSVWWHADLCHAVDPDHDGDENASVIYIGSCPSTPVNQAYIKTQLQATLAGKPPPDYAEGLDTDETQFKGYVGHQGLSEEARGALGYGL
ncbi:hypothetical protein LTR84_001098 [Exophiala bonariae]|uniref:DUF1479 domain protein n=1 Tax=Exophiala bonariae TaxID=1690606 RepID=A0AAV9NT03_9EURO|nr:hypothetical protein LTR84_001098 [Exophiala bonariae]